MSAICKIIFLTLFFRIITLASASKHAEHPTRGHKVTAERLHILRKRGILASYDNFHFLNVTFTCNKSTGDSSLHTIKLTIEDNGTTAQENVLARRVAILETEEMKMFLKYKGGTYIDEYIAVNQVEATRKFVDLRKLRYLRTRHRKNMGGHGEKGRANNQQKGRPNSQQKGRPYSGKLNKKSGPDHPPPNNQHGPFHPGGVRPKRDVTIDTSVPRRVDIGCTAAGTTSDYDPNYLNLCTVCSGKRILSADKYPPVLNEVFCNGSQSGCLGNNNGKCVPTTFTIHILKRKENTCRLCIKQDEALAVDEWELEDQIINVGCECLLSANSYYRQTFFKKSDDNAAIG